MSDEKIDVLAVMDFLADEAAYAAVLSRGGEETDKFGKAASDAVKAHSAVAELVEAASELKEVCNRPSAARTRAESWRRLDRALARVRSS
jgi:hypothetical protein